MQKNEKRIISTKLVVLGAMILALVIFLCQICFFSVNREDSVLGYIQSVTYNKQENLLNFSSQIEYVDFQEIKCKYGDVSYKICFESDTKTIYASMHSSYLRDETIHYIVEDNKIKELSVDDGYFDSTMKFIGLLFIEAVIIFMVTFFLYLTIKIRSMPKLGK